MVPKERTYRMARTSRQGKRALHSMSAWELRLQRSVHETVLVVSCMQQELELIRLAEMHKTFAYEMKQSDVG